jgi:hypothetical protein
MMQNSVAGLRIAPALLRPVCGSEDGGTPPMPPGRVASPSALLLSRLSGSRRGPEDGA